MHRFRAIIHQPMYEHNDKKYLRIRVPPDVAQYITRMEAMNAYKLAKDAYLYEDFFNDTLVAKVPFRYRRVMCAVSGNKPVQELVTGDVVQVEIEYTGAWTAGNYTGHSWKIKNIDT
jgi:hypothetical protein